VFDLEKAKTSQAEEIVDLKKRVKKLERKKSQGRRDDALKHGRIIDNTDQDVEITLVDETLGRMNEEEMFGVDDLDGDEVIMDATTGENVEQDSTVVEKEVSTADPVTTAGEVVTTAKGVEVTIVAAIPKISKDELTLAQNLIEIKVAKPKARGVIVQVPSKFKRTSSSQLSQLLHAKDKGDELEQESAKRQRLKKEDDSVELKRYLKIVPEDEDDVTIEATPISSKSPTIVNDKIYKEGGKATSKSSEHMERFKKTKPMDDMDNLLSQTLKTMFKHQVRYELEMAYDLLRLIKRQINKGYIPK
nr:hypothetical protein [Tanacetum cinerariifolium]